MMNKLSEEETFLLPCGVPQQAGLRSSFLPRLAFLQHHLRKKTTHRRTRSPVGLRALADKVGQGNLVPLQHRPGLGRDLRLYGTNMPLRDNLAARLRRFHTSAQGDLGVWLALSGRH